MVWQREMAFSSSMPQLKTDLDLVVQPVIPAQTVRVVWLVLGLLHPVVEEHMLHFIKQALQGQTIYRCNYDSPAGYSHNQLTDQVAQQHVQS